MEEGVLALAAVAFIFGWPVWITMLIVRHREKMRLLELKQQGGSPAVAEELRDLRRELSHLRETTTTFDMSFDAALDRMERRMERVERSDPAGMETTVRGRSIETDEALRVAEAYRGAEAVPVPNRRS
ncbi:MAG: hypothetical protein H7Z41_17160 [Cytophagales bacterium]|nr:hypothetical protein [Armatimonadota bacterium]